MTRSTRFRARLCALLCSAAAASAPAAQPSEVSAQQDAMGPFPAEAELAASTPPALIQEAETQPASQPASRPVTQPISQPATEPALASESLPLGLPVQETQPIDTPAPESSWGITGVVLPLVGVIALAIGLATLTRRIAGTSGGVAGALGPAGRAPSGLLEVLGRYPVARGSTLVLLRVDRRVLLLNQTAGGRWGGARFTTLSEITEPEDVASILVKAGEDDTVAARAKFGQALAEFEASAPIDGSDAPVAEPKLQARTQSIGQSTSQQRPAVDSLRKRLESLRTEGRA